MIYGDVAQLVECTKSSRRGTLVRSQSMTMPAGILVQAESVMGFESRHPLPFN